MGKKEKDVNRVGNKKAPKTANKSRGREVAHNGESDQQQHVPASEEVTITDSHPKHHVAETCVSGLIRSA